jgi:hypothetical protein
MPFPLNKAPSLKAINIHKETIAALKKEVNEMAKLLWDRVDEAFQCSAGGYVEKAKVPGGWLVKNI